jgi:hypothetical protein
MANAISFYVGGKGNRKLKPRNMSTHLIQSLLDADSHGGIPKRMNFECDGVIINEEIEVRLTPIQHDSLLYETHNRQRVCKRSRA